MPNKFFFRYIRTDVPNLWTHVTVRQLEPSTREHFRKIVLIVMKFLRNFTIFRIHFHRHIGVRHDRIKAHRSIFNIDWLIFFLNINRFPLPSTGWALFKFPFIIKQKLKITAIPLSRLGSPSTFYATRNSVTTNTTLSFIQPTKALIFYFSTFRFGF